VPVKRAYRSDVRRTQASATRARIAAAARRLFATQGFAATTVDAIAQRAGVAVQTVYAVFGSKRAVLESLLDTIDSDAGLEALGRALADPHAGRQAAAVARFLRQLFTRGADVIAAGRAAGTSDPALRALAARGIARHRKGMKQVAEGWAHLGALRADVSATEAADILNAITSYDVFQNLRGSGWTLDRYERWLAAAMVTLVLRRDGERP
jgi:AcrR family transcriptional regulator